MKLFSYHRNKKDGYVKNNSILMMGYFIAFLNLFDGLATNYGLLNNFIEESNPLMALIASASPILFVIIKLLLSLAIILTSYLVYKKCSVQFQRLYAISLIAVCTIYLGIGCLHIYWLSIL